jgi:hypothetical protein
MVQRAQIAVDMQNAAMGLTPPIALNALVRKGVANRIASPPK